MNVFTTPTQSSRQTKKAKGGPKVGTRSSSAQGKRTPLKYRFSPLENLQEWKSSDEEEVAEIEGGEAIKGQSDEHVHGPQKN